MSTRDYSLRMALLGRSRGAKVRTRLVNGDPETRMRRVESTNLDIVEAAGGGDLEYMLAAAKVEERAMFRREHGGNLYPDHHIAAFAQAYRDADQDSRWFLAAVLRRYFALLFATVVPRPRLVHFLAPGSVELGDGEPGFYPSDADRSCLTAGNRCRPLASSFLGPILNAAQKGRRLKRREAAEAYWPVEVVENAVAACPEIVTLVPTSWGEAAQVLGEARLFDNCTMTIVHGAAGSSAAWVNRTCNGNKAGIAACIQVANGEQTCLMPSKIKKVGASMVTCHRDGDELVATGDLGEMRYALPEDLLTPEREITFGQGATA